MNSLKVVITTPEGTVYSDACDSVILTVCDGVNGNEGGSYGVRKGHADAIISIANGPITVKRDGEAVFTARLSDGIAMVKSNTLTVTASRIDK